MNHGLFKVYNIVLIEVLREVKPYVDKPDEISASGFV